MHRAKFINLAFIKKEKHILPRKATRDTQFEKRVYKKDTSIGLHCQYVDLCV